MTSAPTSEAASQPASIISDSVTYCGRFPAMDSNHYRQCGEARRLGGHTSAVTDTGLEQEAVTTAGPQWSGTQPWAPSSWRATPRASATSRRYRGMEEEGVH